MNGGGIFRKVLDKFAGSEKIGKNVPIGNLGVIWRVTGANGFIKNNLSRHLGFNRLDERVNVFVGNNIKINFDFLSEDSS